jgi:hypothetical protein
MISCSSVRLSSIRLHAALLLILANVTNPPVALSFDPWISPPIMSEACPWRGKNTHTIADRRCMSTHGRLRSGCARQPAGISTFNVSAAASAGAAIKQRVFGFIPMFLGDFSQYASS